MGIICCFSFKFVYISLPLFQFCVLVSIPSLFLSKSMFFPFLIQQANQPWVTSLSSLCITHFFNLTVVFVSFVISIWTLRKICYFFIPRQCIFITSSSSLHILRNYLLKSVCVTSISCLCVIHFSFPRFFVSFVIPITVCLPFVTFI